MSIGVPLTLQVRREVMSHGGMGRDMRLGVHPFDSVLVPRREGLGGETLRSYLSVSLGLLVGQNDRVTCMPL